MNDPRENAQPLYAWTDLLKAENENEDEVEDWKQNALCAQTDPEAFFPEKGGSTREAKRICNRCSVRQKCLDDALDRDERFGIWGGLSERERRKLTRSLRTIPPVAGQVLPSAA